MANSVDPDETAHDEPSHQDLHYLHRYLVWSAGLKGFNFQTPQLFTLAIGVSVANIVDPDPVLRHLIWVLHCFLWPICPNT